MTNLDLDKYTNLDDETSYKLLKIFEQNPDVTQRQLASEMGVSIGKINYCVRALIQVGLVKMNNFARSDSKMSYIYLLTPKGVAMKSSIAKRFLAKKLNQYEVLQREIAALQKEVEKQLDKSTSDPGKNNAGI